jgi:hypothetical protein
VSRLRSSEGKIKAMSLWEDISLPAHRLSIETRCDACLSITIQVIDLKECAFPDCESLCRRDTQIAAIERGEDLTFAAESVRKTGLALLGNARRLLRIHTVTWHHAPLMRWQFTNAPA